MTESPAPAPLTDSDAAAEAATPLPQPIPPAVGNASRKRKGGKGLPDAQARAEALALLDQLAAWHPQLFGATFQPLQRGVYEALLAAHPEAIAPDQLRAALQQHTRSTRYLQAIAAGGQRRDLQGQPVEAVAPEHVFQALVELWRRRAGRTPAGEQEALREHWRGRIARAFDASGLSREDYAARVATRNAEAQALLDEALAAHAGVAARHEALLRAFESGGASLEAFAATYGLEPRKVQPLLDQARRRREAAAAAASAAPVADADIPAAAEATGA